MNANKDTKGRKSDDWHLCAPHGNIAINGTGCSLCQPRSTEATVDEAARPRSVAHGSLRAHLRRYLDPHTDTVEVPGRHLRAVFEELDEQQREIEWLESERGRLASKLNEIAALRTVSKVSNSCYLAKEVQEIVTR